MVLFLVLNIGSIFYALYISVWQWNIRTGPVSFLGLDNYTAALADPGFEMTSDTARLSTAAAVIICVPTPVDHYLVPDLRILQGACATVVAAAVVSGTNPFNHEFRQIRSGIDEIDRPGRP